MEYIFSLEFIYLIASITYILGLKMLGHPETARRGNLIAAGGMTIAIFGTIFLYQGDVPKIIYYLIGAAILIGTIVGWAVAKKSRYDKNARTGFTLQWYGWSKCRINWID